MRRSLFTKRKRSSLIYVCFAGESRNARLSFTIQPNSNLTATQPSCPSPCTWDTNASPSSYRSWRNARHVSPAPVAVELEYGRPGVGCGESVRGRGSGNGGLPLAVSSRAGMLADSSGSSAIVGTHAIQPRILRTSHFISKLRPRMSSSRSATATTDT
jgi:hypothetical protein